MTVTGNDPFIGTYNEARWNLAPAVVGQTWTASVWAKGTTATSTAQLFMMESASSGGYLNATAVTVVVGTSWQRVTASHTLANTSTAFVQVRLDGPDSAGTGTNIWWDGLQVERNASATAFSPLTNVNGTAWTDLSGSNNNGTLTNGPTYSSANRGSIVFDGANDYVVINSGVSILSTSAYTKIAWFYPTSFLTNNNLISGGGNHAFWGAGTNRLQAGHGNVSFNTISSTTVLNLNTWYFGAVTFNTTTGWSLYLNGALEATNPSTVTFTGSGDILIGSYGTGNVFTGSISNAMVYNRVLTLNEIQQNFNAMRGKFGI
jgi:hypothetical protein